MLQHDWIGEEMGLRLRISWCGNGGGSLLMRSSAIASYVFSVTLTAIVTKIPLLVLTYTLSPSSVAGSGSVTFSFPFTLH